MKSQINFVQLTLLMLGYLSIVVNAHSQMRCAKYDTATGKCSAPIRNQGAAFVQESYLFFNGAAICQSPMTNPITAAYENGNGCPDWAPCPDKMGTYAPGERFTVMWFARNHAVENQNPATVFLYLSPKESVNQGQDVSQATMVSNLICSGPFMNCGGVNQDTTPCTLTCNMPSNLQAGIYTLWWKWDWQGSMYATCADINVSGSSGSSSGSSASSTTGRQNQPATTGRQNQPVTTGRQNQPVTTGRQNQVTTGQRNTPVITTGRIVGETAMCYKPGTPNLNGKIRSNPPVCGKKAPRARCADGQCCSQWGYCGPWKDGNGNYVEYTDQGYTIVTEAYAFGLYCNKTSGDYRKLPCDSIVSGSIVGNYQGKANDGSLIMNITQLRSIIIIGFLLGFISFFWN